MQLFQKLAFLVLVVWVSVCARASPDDSFQGHYRVGPTSCTVTPARMSFELRWARGSGSMNFFFDSETEDGKVIFVSEEQPGGRDRFEFDDRRLVSGRFVRADGKTFPVQKLRP